MPALFSMLMLSGTTDQPDSVVAVLEALADRDTESEPVKRKEQRLKFYER